MTTYPNCKINLGLRVVSRRPDGYHNIESIFLPVASLHDELEIVPDPTLSPGQCRFHGDGLALDCTPDDNLCLKAYRLLHDEFGDRIGGVHMRLVKHIPSGAGLGGGSADAAFTLRMLNDLFALQLTDGQLSALAARIGADCPFFIINRAAYVSGIGDIIEPLDFALPEGLRVEIRKPDVSVSTREAYAGITPRDQWHSPAPDQLDLRQALSSPVEQWRQLFVNDFEASVFRLHPTIEQLKQQLYAEGAMYAAMSGSGSAVFGLFQK